MRDSIKEILKLVLYGMAIVLVFSLTRFVNQATKDVHQTAIQAQLTMTEVGTTARMVRAQVVGISPVLEETRKAIRQARTLIDVALKTSLNERANVQKSSDETVALLGHADKLVANLDYRTKVLTDSLTLTADQAQQTLAESSKAMDAAAGLMSDPQIHSTLTNLNTTSVNLAVISGNFAAITTDGKILIHNTFFPPPTPFWKKPFHYVGATLDLGVDAEHIRQKLLFIP
jgi:hypothetical protein